MATMQIFWIGRIVLATGLLAEVFQEAMHFTPIFSPKMQSIVQFIGGNQRQAHFAGFIW
jgi:hypothetical protein